MGNKKPVFIAFVGVMEGVYGFGGNGYLRIVVGFYGSKDSEGGLLGVFGC